MDLIAVMLGIQHAEFGGVVFVDLGILGVEVVDRALQHANGGNRVDSLPDEVRRVEIRTDGLARLCASVT